MPKRLVIVLAILLLIYAYRPATAVLTCDACSCNNFCTQSCFLPGGGTSTCASTGLCRGSSSCGGGGCLAAIDSALRDKSAGDWWNVVSNNGPRPAQTVARLSWRLTQHVEESGLGTVYATNTAFLLPVGKADLKAPDLAFVRADVASQNKVSAASHRNAPDLVVDVLSSSALAAAGKIEADKWLAAGAQAVLMVDPDRRVVAVSRKGMEVEELGAGDTLELQSIVPGWRLDISDLFK